MAKQTDGQGHAPMPTMQAVPRICAAGSLRAHISMACAPPHAGVGAFEPAGLCTSSCWNRCLWTCWCWQTFTLFSAAPAAWIHPYYLGSASGAAATTDSQSLLSAYGLGSREDAWNLLGVGIFISYNLHKQETVSVFVYLFNSLCLLLHVYFTFRLWCRTASPCLSFSLPIVCSVLVSNDSDLFSPFLSALSHFPWSFSH